ncbi:MAG TPA: VUT family protein [Solirubrobacteraceae bacterium]|nr:VUT family protein [Solirubrobacteraceae bacterium]
MAAIVTANLLAARYGAAASVYNAFALIGLDLITRDRLADFWGTRRWAKMAALIAAGSILSYCIAQGAAVIAEASAVSFALAETGEALLYHQLRRREWLERANAAAWVGAAIDSFVFPTLAFGGVMWGTTVGQFTAKTAGALLWSAVLMRIRAPRREVLA